MRILSFIFLLLAAAPAFAQDELRFTIGERAEPQGALAVAFGEEMPCVAFGTSVMDTCAFIYAPVVHSRVDSITLTNAAHFSLVSPNLPAYLYGGDTIFAVAKYDGLGVGLGYDTTGVTFHTSGGKYHTTAKVCVLFVISVREENASNMNDLSSRIARNEKFAWLAPTPNPVTTSNSVRFVFGLSERAEVSLELYDMSGKRAAFITKASYEPGIHDEYFETKTLAKGSYVYRYTVSGVAYGGKLLVE